MSDAARMIAGAIADAANEAARRAVRAVESKSTATFQGRDSEGKPYVLLPGSDEAMPVSQMAVDAKSGDSVRVSFKDGRAVVEANLSNPAAGISTVELAQETAEDATRKAGSAAGAAANAQASADSAGIAAGMAQESANRAIADAQSAQQSAASAAASAEAAQESAETAAEAAESASEDAREANVYAKGALYGLSDVERVVGTLNWVSEHGRYVGTTDVTVDPKKVYYRQVVEYEPTSDESIVSGKTYYTRSGEGTEADPYVYAPVETPDVSEIATYYEVSSVSYEVVTDPVDSELSTYYVLVVDESFQNYIASHVAQTDYGLDLMIDDSDFRIHIGSVDGNSAVGTYIVDDAGIVVSSFGTDGVRVGSPLDMHVEIRGNRMSFLSPGYTLPDDMTGHDPTEPFDGEVAFLAVDDSGQSMFYMNRSVVVKDLRFGKWVWKSRENNNMSLRWYGE